MQKETYEIDGGRCDVIWFREPRLLLLQPVDEHDLDGMERETALIAETEIPFALAGFKIGYNEPRISDKKMVASKLDCG